MKGKKLKTLEEDLEEEEEEEELESELVEEQETELELETQFESETQELSPRSMDKKEKVGQGIGVSALAFGQSVPQAESLHVKRLEPGRVEGRGAKCPLPPVKEI